MKYLIDMNTFIKIFSVELYREKLDKLILDFFGLDTTTKINNLERGVKNNTLEFVIFINRSFIFKIVVEDNKYLFKESKKFYINFSFEEKKKNYILLYPCYWEFYCYNCLKSGKIKKDLEYIAALLAATKMKEVKKILKKLKIFNNDEINDIMIMIEK